MTMPILPGHRRRPEDEQVARQPHRRGRAARGAVRPHDEHPRRRAGRVVPAPRRRPSRRPPGHPGAGEAPARAPRRRPLPRRRGGSGPRPHFNRVVRDRRAPDEIPEVPCPPGAGAPARPPGRPPRRRLAQRGAAPDRRRRRQPRRRAGAASSTWIRRALRGACPKAGKRRFARLVLAADALSDEGPERLATGLDSPFAGRYTPVTARGGTRPARQGKGNRLRLHLFDLHPMETPA